MSKSAAAKVFSSREEAGRALASLLVSFAGREDVVLVAIPRGGVPVATEISARLSLPLQVLVAERIQAPYHDAWQQRLSIGAVAPGGVQVLDTARISELGIPTSDAELALKCSRMEQTTKETLYAGTLPTIPMCGRTVILIDDAIETGSTVRAAMQALQAQEPARVYVAALAVHEPAYRTLSTLATQVYCLARPPAGVAPHTFLSEFPPLTDEDAIAILGSHRDRKIAE